MIARLLVTLILLLTCPLALLAQPRPGAFTTITASNTGATAIDVAGGITAGTGNVGIVDATGKIPAISSTYFASLSGTNLTGVALLASANTFTGQMNISASAPAFVINESDQALDSKKWLWTSTAGSFSLTAISDSEASGNVAFSVTRSTTSPVAMTLGATLILRQVTFASLSGGAIGAVDGAVVYCTNCDRAGDPCLSGGVGTVAMLIQNQWKCM